MAKVNVDNETVKHLCALQKVNEALIEGLKSAFLHLRIKKTFQKTEGSP